MKPTQSMILGTLLFTSIPMLSAQTPAAKTTTTKTAKAMLEVDPHFVDARRFYDKGQFAKSADEIMAASNCIVANIGTQYPKLQAPALKASGNLDKLAVRVRGGTIKEAQTLDKNFASASHLMAKYHASVAEKATAEKKNAVAGNAFKRTADYVENTAKWSGQKLGDAGKATVSGLREIGGSLVNAGGTVVKGTGTVLKKGLNLIGNMGRALTGQPKTPTPEGKSVIEKAGESIKKTGEKVTGKDKPAPKK